MDELKCMAKRIEDIRIEFLFNRDELNDETLTPLAAQEYLIALAYLELAHRAMTKAWLISPCQGDIK